MGVGTTMAVEWTAAEKAKGSKLELFDQSKQTLAQTFRRDIKEEIEKTIGTDNLYCILLILPQFIVKKETA